MFLYCSGGIVRRPFAQQIQPMLRRFASQSALPRRRPAERHLPPRSCCHALIIGHVEEHRLLLLLRVIHRLLLPRDDWNGRQLREHCTMLRC